MAIDGRRIKLCDDRKTPVAFITGAAGQDGSYLAEFLLGKGYRVIGMARRDSLGETPRLSAAKQHEDFVLVEGDVTDLSSLLLLIKKYGPDEIYNLAAQSHVGTSFKQPFYTTRVVYDGFLNVCEAVLMLGVEHCTKIYQASSSEMFGSKFNRACGTDGRSHLFQNESTPMAPNSPYAIAKKAAHNAARVYREAYGMFISCGILFNHESIRRPPSFVTRKVTRYVADLITYGFREKLKLGNLAASRDWGFAGDYVEAMWLMLQQPVADDYVIATGKTHTIRDLVVAAFKEYDSALPPKDILERYVEIDESLKRPKEVPYLCGDASKAKQVLGWEPKVSFGSLIKAMVAHDL